jgi:hypothetical protein
LKLSLGYRNFIIEIYFMSSLSIKVHGKENISCVIFRLHKTIVHKKAC